MRLSRAPCWAHRSRAGPPNEHRADLQGLALTGGEDYELLFTATPDKAARLGDIKESFDVPITEIGVVTARSDGVKVIGPDGKPMELDSVGYEHFKAR